MAETASILIVDNDVNFTTATVDLFNEKGFHCMGVYSGREAIDKVREMAFDVILLDMKMPVMNGVETYREIKKIRPRTVVILVTAYRVEELIQDALEEGAYAVLKKPLDIDRVVAMIEQSRKVGALIMVADGDPNTCEALKGHLEIAGYVVTTGLYGEAAIEMVRERPHDIVLIDAMLPPLNGLILFLEMKKINPNVVAVMMTLYGEETRGIIEAALDQGVYTCLYKPFNMDEVTEMLDDIINEMKGGK